MLKATEVVFVDSKLAQALVERLDPVADGKRRGGLEVRLAADVGGEDGGGRTALQRRDLVRQQALRQLRLEDGVSSRRTAAQMCLRHIGQRIAKRSQQ